MKQTAIDWFEYQLKDNLGNIVINQNWQLLEDLIEQAKAMEKEQIIDAFWNGDNTDCLKEQNAKEFAEQYYKTTFKSE